MRHWILSKMIHCPCENELVYLLEKTVMLEEKCLLGKYKYKSTVMNGAETMKDLWSQNQQSLPATIIKSCQVVPAQCSAQALTKTSSHICKSWFNHGHHLAPEHLLSTKAGWAIPNPHAPGWCRSMTWTWLCAHLSPEPSRAVNSALCSALPCRSDLHWSTVGLLLINFCPGGLCSWH